MTSVKTLVNGLHCKGEMAFQKNSTLEAVFESFGFMLAQTPFPYSYCGFNAQEGKMKIAINSLSRRLA